MNQFDPLTCTPALLNLLAYDRDITRFDGEPLTLFRKRVAFAFVNARDAGSVEGFINIFERLGIGYVELLERQPGIDWDVILVRVTDSQIADNTQLLIQIIPICFCAGLRGTWSDRSPQKTVFSVCSFVNW